MPDDGPHCQADDCDRLATNEIHGIVLDGTEYSVYTCGEHHE